jgi:polyphosphate kinase
MFADLREHDVLLHHPYDAFSTVEEFVHFAAEDPRVLAIKHTIYRTGETSAIVRDLIHAAETRKQVTVVVELKARFDEEANIRWAKRMERAGVHVVYGIVGLKTHAKATLVVRREDLGIRRYCHVGSGNYNPTTARVYTDIGLLTAHEKLAEDVADLFNMITGYAKVPAMEQLLVAPFTLRSQLLAMIDQEIANARAGKPSRIRAKLNALVDPIVITRLYEASGAGVEVRLCIRGICCLRPGVPGLSENIRAFSVVDRFLEHSRIYYFENDGSPGVYVSSADWMPRNLDRRVEAAFPLPDPKLRQRVVDILNLSLADNVKSREILADGGFVRRVAGPDEAAIQSQAVLLAQHAPNPTASPPPQKQVRGRGQHRGGSAATRPRIRPG